MTRFGIWLMTLMERWMAWLERPFLLWLERRIREKKKKKK